MLPAAHWSFYLKNTYRLVGQLIAMGHLGLSVIAQDFPGDMPLSKCCYPIRTGNVQPMGFNSPMEPVRMQRDISTFPEGEETKTSSTE